MPEPAGTSQSLAGVTESLPPGGTVPLVIQPASNTVRLADWISQHREQLESRLVLHGAVLFRGFNVSSVDEFNRFIHAASDRVMTYRERSSPRSQLGEQIYSSTDYPPTESIFPHNEHSYAKTFPLRLFFGCETPAPSGGETPLGDCRKVLQHIPTAVQERFAKSGWMYVRNFGDGFGLPWPTVFQTDKKSEVEVYCRDSDIQYEWKDGGRLRTRQVRDAMAKHPRTGDLVWFNHVAFFHITTLNETARDLLLEAFGQSDLPNNTYYGNGSDIDASTLEILREAYRREMVPVKWQRGDALIVDNLLTAHARMPYKGNRRILFAMAEPTSRSEVKV
jgi:hypothetical protein